MSTGHATIYVYYGVVHTEYTVHPYCMVHTAGMHAGVWPHPEERRKFPADFEGGQATALPSALCLRWTDSHGEKQAWIHGERRGRIESRHGGDRRTGEDDTRHADSIPYLRPRGQPIGGSSAARDGIRLANTAGSAGNIRFETYYTYARAD